MVKINVLSFHSLTYNYKGKLYSPSKSFDFVDKFSFYFFFEKPRRFRFFSRFDLTGKESIIYFGLIVNQLHLEKRRASSSEAMTTFGAP